MCENYHWLKVILQVQDYHAVRKKIYWKDKRLPYIPVFTPNGCVIIWNMLNLLGLDLLFYKMGELEITSKISH